MTIVIDVGAARYGGDYSIERLIEQFSPSVLYAIDPNAELVKPAGFFPNIELIHKAAWTHDGTVRYRADGLNSWVTEDASAPEVPCLDLANFVDDVWMRHETKIVLKLDCEGSEYELLPYLIGKNADSLLDLCIVEWHPKTTSFHEQIRKLVEESIKCELQEWPY